jgi:hypothetical protein
MQHAMVIAGVGTMVAALAFAPAATSAPAARGVTRTTVTVGGLVAGDPVAKDADLGATARFERANRKGRIGGRTIDYLGTRATTDATAVTVLVDTAFAAVPAIGISQDAATLSRESMPFVGVAGSPAWFGNRWGFGITGVSLAERSTAGSPAWGVQLRALLGGSRRKSVVVVTDGDALGAVRAAETNAALRSAGFRVSPAVALPSPVDAAATARALVAPVPPPAAVLLLATDATSLGIAQQLAALGYTGTVGVGDTFYVPVAPAFGAGLTVLVPIAPLEADTPAIRRMVADVRAVDSTAAITPAVAEGYFSADFFLAVLAKVGRRLTARRFLAVANGGTFTYEVPATIGRSTWPAMHTRGIPCGALVQGDGTRYFLAEPYRCDPLVRLPAKLPTR